MLSEIPRCVVDQSRAAWRASRERRAPIESKVQSTPPLHHKRAEPRVCLFSEEELSQPAPAREKKPAPAEGVSFF